MREVILTRTETSDEGTIGQVVTDDGFKCSSIELPERDNAPGKSCIPLGIYPVNWRLSPKHGMCYHVDEVKDRTDIEIHAANFAGDADKGLKCELLGCLALGLFIGKLDGQTAALSSKAAIALFNEHMKQEPFELTILEIL